MEKKLFSPVLLLPLVRERVSAQLHFPFQLNISSQFRFDKMHCRSARSSILTQTWERFHLLMSKNVALNAWERIFQTKIERRRCARARGRGTKEKANMANQLQSIFVLIFQWKIMVRTDNTNWRKWKPRQNIEHVKNGTLSEWKITKIKTENVTSKNNRKGWILDTQGKVNDKKKMLKSRTDIENWTDWWQSDKNTYVKLNHLHIHVCIQHILSCRQRTPNNSISLFPIFFIFFFSSVSFIPNAMKPFNSALDTRKQ